MNTCLYDSPIGILKISEDNGKITNLYLHQEDNVTIHDGSLGNYMRNKHLYQQYTLEELVFNMLFVSLRGVCTLKGIEQLDQFFTTAKR